VTEYTLPFLETTSLTDQIILAILLITSAVGISTILVLVYFRKMESN
jgi:hypothetical protein